MHQVTLDNSDACNNNTLFTKSQDNSTVMVQSISVTSETCYYTLFVDVSNE